jgi:radical SAM protein with 4Fe4S-binding SPASM domain
MSTQYARVPQKINVETTNACNLGCVMCSQTTGTFAKGYMSYELFCSIADQVKRLDIEQLRYHWRGEVLTHPQWEAIITYPGKIGIPRPTLFTNAVLLDEAHREKIFASGIAEIHFSLDGTESRTNELIRRRIPFERVVGNIERFIEERNNQGIDIKVVMHMTLLRQNQHEVSAYINRWKELADDILVSDAWGCGDQGVSVKRIWSDQPPSRLRPRNMCRFVQERLFVGYDGLVYPCSVPHSGQMPPIGDLNQQTLEEVWEGAALAKLRSYHEQRKHDQIAPCNTCNLNGSAIYSLRHGILIR